MCIGAIVPLCFGLRLPEAARKEGLDHFGGLRSVQAAAQRGRQRQWHRRVLADQAVEVLAVEAQDFALALRAHRRRTRLVGEQGHLADNVALAARA